MANSQMKSRKQLKGRFCMGTVVIVDDHPLIRIAVRILLEKKGHTVLAEAGNGVDAIQLIRTHEPQVLVLDLDIPKLDGLSVMSHLKSSRFAGKILILTASASADFARRCLKAGAAGFMSKDGELDEIANAVQALLSGLSYFPGDTMALSREGGDSRTHSASSPLTNREITILRLLIKGKKNRDIATTLFISHKTVSTYKSRLLRKFNATSLLELVEIVRRGNSI
ncbi:response regulator transcription factor [Pseudomonas chlororaphis]|jgi:two-component system response regulator EvgA|uniref:response regulator transcription factor n=2 Tax=Pseudomonas chlororaphis TaxID=587753 RepID=UPI0028832315|nr:response regulator transcription factor [Pseudomonas chlororaphis]